MKEGSIKITLKEAKELFNSTISWGVKEKLLKDFSERELSDLPEKLEISDICIPRITYKIIDNRLSEVITDTTIKVGYSCEGLYPGKKECISAIAFRELMWLVREYTKRACIPEPNWNDRNQQKYCIIRQDYRILVDNIAVSRNYYYPLAFTSEKIAKVFLEDHRELIMRYYML